MLLMIHIEKRIHNFLLNYETLEGTWHPFIKHPLATDESFTIDTIENLSENLSIGLTNISQLIYSVFRFINF